MVGISPLMSFTGRTSLPGLGGTGVGLPGGASAFGGGGLAGMMGGLNSPAFSSIGGGAPGLDAASLHNMGVSNSSLMLMAQINMMMASVLSGIGMLMQQIMASAQQRQQAGGSASFAGPGSSPSGSFANSATGVAPGGGGGPLSPPGTGSADAQSVIAWARAEKAKGIDEATDQDYISQNYSRGRVEAWCADFVSTAMAKNGGSPWGHMPAVASIANWAKQHNAFYAKGTGEPRPGDVIIFQGQGMSHVAIVTGVSNGRVHTIGGNESDTIKEQSYALNDGRITGYVDMARARQVA